MPTPLLRWGSAMLKLDMGRLWPAWEPARSGAVEATGNVAIAAAEWARRKRLEIAIVPRGVFTHEMREILKLWGVPMADEATLPPLDSDAAVAIFARTYREELPAKPSLVVAPAGDRAALLGATSALGVRGVALVAADEELPDLPRSADLPDAVERVAVTRAQAAAARAQVARELGLLAGHAAAAAAVYANQHGGIALVMSPGEREFSLDRSP